jgi:hypothetical protein
MPGSPNFDLFTGPAVVVDDKIGDPGTGMVAIVQQIRDAGFPVIELTELPESTEVKHWGSFSLIVLDWELFASESVPGVAMPDALADENARQVSEFVHGLLGQLYAPIFIFSNQSVEVIEDELAARINIDGAEIATRVMVRSKLSVESDLLSELATWVRDRPAVYALKRWEAGYADAKRQMFLDFELSSSAWPRILWAASRDDGVNPHFELTETISRNILHRFEPLVFDDTILASGGGEAESGSALRQVIHRSAVVDNSSLHEDVIMPGDFFILKRENSQDQVGGGVDPQRQILINVTPACDLVPRSGVDLDTVRMTLLEGNLMDITEFESKTKRERLRKGAEPTEEIIWVLRVDGRPYRFKFKSWNIRTWGELKEDRLGRLLDPYVTLLQQRFALHFHRQGLPRIPERFYEYGA